jgi:hypothetical protein
MLWNGIHHLRLIDYDDVENTKKRCRVILEWKSENKIAFARLPLALTQARVGSRLYATMKSARLMG